jgi:small subunit ribosomal protein S6
MANVYDLILLVHPEAPEGRREEILSQVRGMIEAGGTLLTERDWGLRQLAYEIDHQADADYHVFEFESGRELLEELNRTLKITDGLMRFRIIKLPPGAPEPPDLQQLVEPPLEPA